MIPLLCFIILVVLVIVAIELRERRRKQTATAQPSTLTSTTSADSACCGTHLVCERETLLNTSPKIEYYDDEELDALAGIQPDDFSDEQYEQLAEVFHSLREADIIGWVRSLQLRNIELPLDLREEALLIVREQRQKSQV